MRLVCKFTLGGGVLQGKKDRDDQFTLGGGYYRVKRMGMTVGNPRKLP